MKARPILFKSEMIRALLAGRKTQTRRLLGPDAADTMDFLSGCGKYRDEGFSSEPEIVSVMWGQPEEDNGEGGKPQWLAYMDDYPEEGVLPIGVGHGRQGDLLWVRETWCPVGELLWNDKEFGGNQWIDYRATPRYEHSHPAGWENAPDDPGALKWRPSIFMPRRASRLTLKITNVRVQRLQEISETDAMAEGVEWKDRAGMARFTAGKLYRELWDSINAKRGYSWDANPWAWAITFEIILQNVDAYILQRATTGPVKARA